MSRRMKVTERVGGTWVCGSSGETYRWRRTLWTEREITSVAWAAERKREAPGWVRSRISRRSLGRGKAVLSFVEWDFLGSSSIGFCWTVRSETGSGVAVGTDVAVGAGDWDGPEIVLDVPDMKIEAGSVGFEDVRGGNLVIVVLK